MAFCLHFQDQGKEVPVPFTAAQVMEFTEQEDVKFVRLAFFDALGHPKAVSIAPCQLYRAFTRGIPFDPFGIDGCSIDTVMLRLVPIPDTCMLLPQNLNSEKSIRMYCSIRNPDGTPFQGDSREILYRADQAAAKMGLSLRFSWEYTFYLFTADLEGNSTRIPHDRAGYLDTAPLDKGEQIREEICLALEQMHVYTCLSQHYRGPGQHLIRCCSGSAMETADNAVSFCMAVHTIAHRHGLCASFVPKPLPNAMGNGLHICVSGAQHTDSFFAGIQTHLRDMTAFGNPTCQSYERLHTLKAENRTSPVYISDEEPGRIILTAPDPAANPYILLALLIYAGLDGIRCGLSPAEDYGFGRLPHTLQEASRFAGISDFIGAVLPRQVIDAYCMNSK